MLEEQGQGSGNSSTISDREPKTCGACVWVLTLIPYMMSSSSIHVAFIILFILWPGMSVVFSLSHSCVEPKRKKEGKAKGGVLEVRWGCRGKEGWTCGEMLNKQYYIVTRVGNIGVLIQQKALMYHTAFHLKNWKAVFWLFSPQRDASCLNIWSIHVLK